MYSINVYNTGIGICASYGREPPGRQPYRLGELIQALQQRHVQQSVDDPQLCSLSAGEPVAVQRRTSRPRTDARTRDARRLHRPLDQPDVLGQLQRALFSVYIQRKRKL